MKPSFSLDQSHFYYPGQEIRISESSAYLMSSDDAKNIAKTKTRLVLIAVLFAFLFCVVLVRLFEYTVLGESGDKIVKKRSVTSTIINTGRADIVDRNGVLLATMVPVFDLEANTALIDDVEEVATDLVGVLPSLDYQMVKKKLLRKNANVVLYRDLIPQQKYDINYLGHPALNFSESFKRIYPQDNLFSHVLGGVNLTEDGNAGIELYLDKEIKESHKPLQLSLDSGIQYEVRKILSEAISLYEAVAGIAIIMDVNTGEIIAMVSLPDFDLNHPSAPSDASHFNRASLGVYEFGSVFKIFNTALALETNVVKLNEKVDSSTFTHGKRIIKDDHPQNRPLTLAEILAHSSNPASARVALKIGIEKQNNFFQTLGFMTKTSIELSEKGKPIVPTRLSEDNLISNAFGYAISITPIHLLTAVSAMVNGGVLYPATLLKQDKAPAGTRVMSEDTSLKMREMLRYVVLRGSGRRSEVPGYEIGGKTGTAEKVLSRGFEKNVVRATYVSAFPMSEPKYAMLIMLDEPKAKGARGRTAGYNAVPTTKKVLEKIAPQLNVLPNLMDNSDH